jgi:DNA-binding response OmpR family regulator
MNLTFGVCWIEDQASAAQVEAVENAIRKFGFEPEITRIETQADIDAFSKKQFHFHEFDLILLDLHLGNNVRGNDLAQPIREKFRSTPILFYSSVPENDLRTMMCEKQIEGFYCAHRDRLTARIEELLEAFTPALNRLSSMRGLAARVVAECDQELRIILLHLAGDANTHNAMMDSIKARLKQSATDRAGALASVADVPTLLDGPIVPSGVLFAEAKEQARAANGSDEVRNLLSSLKGYPKSLLWRRNVLAHALEERTEDGWIIRRQNAKPMTVADFERFRRDFLGHLKDIRALRELLVSQQA